MSARYLGWCSALALTASLALSCGKTVRDADASCTSCDSAGAGGARAGSTSRGGSDAGAAGSAAAGGIPPTSCDTEANLESFRPLMALDINRTVDQLLAPDPGVSFDPGLAPDQRGSPIPFSPSYVAVLYDFARARAERFAADAKVRLACGDVPEGECVSNYLRMLAAQLYRRPLSDAEFASLGSMYDAVRAGGTLQGALEEAIVALLMSPYFSWRLELGELDAAGDVIPLTDYELAARLSYFLWRTAPDAELARAAESGELSSPEEVAAQARRMLGQPVFRDEGLIQLYSEWLDLREPSATNPITPELWSDMQQQFSRFVGFHWDGDRQLQTLFTSASAPLNGALAEHFQVAGGGNDDFAPVELDPSRFAGVLTLGTTLVGYENPVRRGLFVRFELLCQEIPPPPGLIDVTLPPAPTRREQYELAMSEPSCAGCHDLIDRVGFGLEGFDAEGRPQAADTSGVVEGVDGASPTFVGPRELGEILANSADANRCAAERWYEYALDRPALSERENANVDCFAQALRDAGGDLGELAVFIARSRAFRMMPRWTSTVPPAPPPSSSALDHAIGELESLFSVASSDAPQWSELASHLEALRQLRQTQP